MEAMRANVYIDGFNLYFGSLKGTRFKWLDLAAMCHRLLPGRDINRIRFFSARITPLPHNSDAPDRQDAYLRALGTLPGLSVHLGRFTSRPTNLPVFPLTYPYQNGPAQTVRVLRTEEKRTDVNLATYLMLDCMDDEFDEVVVISNDSDLVLPIELAAKRFGKIAGVISPQRRSQFSRSLLEVANWYTREINRRVLAASQFPDVVQHPRGLITKPATW